MKSFLTTYLVLEPDKIDFAELMESNKSTETNLFSNQALPDTSPASWTNIKDYLENETTLRLNNSTITEGSDEYEDMYNSVAVELYSDLIRQGISDNDLEVMEKVLGVTKYQTTTNPPTPAKIVTGKQI